MMFSVLSDPFLFSSTFSDNKMPVKSLVFWQLLMVFQDVSSF